MPVWGIRRLGDLFLNPLQIDSDELFEALTVTSVKRQVPTVVPQSVHPVFIDELNEPIVEFLDGMTWNPCE